MIDTLTSILAAISLTPTDGLMVVVGTVLLFVLHSSLKTAVFQPLLGHVEQREVVTAGALLTASQMRQKAQALRTRYDEALFQARVEANLKRSEIVRAAKEQASTIVAQAESEAAKEIQSGRAAIAAQLESAQTKSQTEAQELARTLVAQVNTQLTMH